ncbi:MAG TPA: pyridoxamine 5'-phosphate oxidase family protein [Gaiellaceae bacterium]
MVSRDAFLSERRIAILATVDADGSAYLTAVWYLWDDGVFLVPTGGTSRKARNAAERPRASIVLDARGPSLAGISATGHIEVLRGDAALALNGRIHRRYVTPEGMENPGLGGLLRAGDDVTLRLVPERWQSWDLGPVFGSRLGDSRLVYPLVP